MRYELYFGQLNIGVVTQTDSDFPSLWGDISYDTAWSQLKSNEAIRFGRFLELNCESMRLVDVEHERDVSAELDAINRKLEEFQDHVDSDDWYLVDEIGARLPILCPIFRAGGKIVWRWGLARDLPPGKA